MIINHIKNNLILFLILKRDHLILRSHSLIMDTDMIIRLVSNLHSSFHFDFRFGFESGREVAVSMDLPDSF